MAQHGEQASDVLGYADAWSQRIRALDDRAAAVKSYVSAWETLRTSHAALLTAISNNDATSALAVAHAIYATIAPDISALQKAYSGGT